MLCKIPWCLEMSFRWQFWSPELRDLTMVRLVYGWIKESGAHNSRVDYQFTIGHSWSPHRGPGHPMDRSRVSRPISAWESADQSQSQTHKSERETEEKLLRARGGGGCCGRRQSATKMRAEKESDCNHHLINRDYTGNPSVPHASWLNWLQRRSIKNSSEILELCKYTNFAA